MGVKNRSKPPRLGEWVLKRCLRNEDRWHRVGDFEEVFQYITESEDRFYAWRWYWWQMIRSIPELLKNIFYWRGAMFTNYVKIAIRNIGKRKGYSFINISGLAIGMACCILISLYVRHELSYDRFHQDRNRLFRIVPSWEYPDGIQDYTRIAPAAIPAMLREFPEIEQTN